MSGDDIHLLLARNRARLHAVEQGAAYVRELMAGVDMVSAGVIIEGFIEGLRIGLATRLHPEIAYNVLQRAADEAARPVLPQVELPGDYWK